MKLIILILGMIAYANCTLGLLAGLLGGFGRAPAPAQSGPIVISNNDVDDGDSAPIYIPYPVPYGGFGGYGYGPGFKGGYY